MWLDDDGDDDPFPGPVPDPSARQWRHPSEIAAENAKAAEQAMAMSGAQASNFIPVGAPAGSTSILWPMTVVGGSIAIAAFGVLGLYLLGNPGRSELSAVGSTTDPAETVGGGLPAQARLITGSTTLGNLNPFSTNEADEGADAGDVASDGDVGPNRVETEDDEAAAQSRPQADGSSHKDDKSSQSGDKSAGETEASDEESGAVGGGGGGAASEGGPAGPQPAAPNGSQEAPPGDSRARDSQPPLADLNELSGPGIYPGRGRGDERLASLLVTDQHLITSASAVAGYQQFFIHLEDRRIPAYVAHSDPFSDVAVISFVDETEDLAILGIPMALEPVQLRAEAFVGYCQSEIRPETPTGVTSDPVTTDPVTNDPVTVDPRPGCSDGREYPDAAGPGTEQGSGGTDNGRSPDDEGDYVSPIEPASSPNPLSGTIYATDVALETRSDHTAYDLIRTDIERPVGGAGAPLRDVLGRLVGLVLGSDGYQVAALPIERVLSVADSLVRWNVGSQAWIGVTGHDGQNGFVVESVHEASPLAGLLAPDDIVLTVNGKRLLGQDHLVYLVRETGVGQLLTITYRQPKQNPGSIEVLVAVHPDSN